MRQLPQIVSPPFWYALHWFAWLAVAAPVGYFVIRYSVFWALKAHTLWKASQGL